MRISDWSSDVCSSDLAKCELLGIRSERIEACGAVSREVAVAMAEGAIERSHADIALAVTGYAGAAPPGEEAGLVHFACGRRGGLTAHREEHFGDIGRGPVRIGAIRVALRSEEHTSELQSLMRISYAVFCLKKKTN